MREVLGEPRDELRKRCPSTASYLPARPGQPRPVRVLVRLCYCVAYACLLWSFHGSANAQPKTIEPPTQTDKNNILTQFVRNWEDFASGHTADELTIVSDFYPIYRVDDGFLSEPISAEFDEQFVQLPSWLTVISYQGAPIAGVKIDMPSVTDNRVFDVNEASRMLNFIEGDKFITFLPKDHYFILRSGRLIPVSTSAIDRFPNGISIEEYRGYVQEFIVAAVPPGIQRIASLMIMVRSSNRIIVLALAVFMVIAIGGAMVRRVHSRRSR